MQSRRWPIITIGLIALNIVAFLGTHWTMEQQDPQVAAVRAHVLMLAAMHPEVTLPDNVKDFVETYKQKHPGIWKQVANPNREVEDAWDAKMRLMEEPQQFQREMDSLALQFQNETEASVVGQYAFTPAHPQAISFLSANFLHAGWLHLIGNMWFLWLAGLILEDTWGRAVYIIFYLVAGAFALEVHAFANPDSAAPSAVRGCGFRFNPTDASARTTLSSYPASFSLCIHSGSASILPAFCPATTCANLNPEFSCGIISA